MTAAQQHGKGLRPSGVFLGDVASVLGGGATVTFFLTNWWLSTLSPLPWLAGHGAAAGIAISVAVGVLLGLRARRAGRAMLFTALSLGVGAAGLALVLSAPALAGVPGASDIAALTVPSRVVVSLFLLTPPGLLGSIVGASVAAGQADSGAA